MLFLESINHSCSSSCTAGKPLHHLLCFYAFDLSEWLKEPGFSPSPRPEMVAGVIHSSVCFKPFLSHLIMGSQNGQVCFKLQFPIFSSHLSLCWLLMYLHLLWALGALPPSMRFIGCSQKLFLLLLAVAYVNAAMWHSLSAALKPDWLHLDQSLLNFCLLF